MHKFITDGWAVVNLPDVSAVYAAIDGLEAEAYRITGAAVSLGEYHRYITDFDHFHLCMAQYFWEMEYGMAIARSCMPIVREFVGADIMAQYKPYLRIARPDERGDNIGYHKDTQYGQTPYELAIHVPFVDLDENMALKVISGTHLLHEDEFRPTASEKRLDNKKHELGYPYAPKLLSPPPGAALTPMALTIGQVAVFSPALFHGQETNEGESTRMSIDLRVCNSFRCKPEKVGKEQNQYQLVEHSPTEILATKYMEAQHA